ncbi:ALBINO3-like protein 2 [Citrus sinensis]|uniref:ALBINO3-like protein 2 n=1 Tax=Citrus sinensis TaxID=2711 RepID=A0ACB8P5I3_CITSI|nr:ALBINO3-like protein 2 [Citrus sinensis]
MATAKLLLLQLRRCSYYSHPLSRAPLCHLFNAPIPTLAQTQTQTPQRAFYFRPHVHFYHSGSADDSSVGGDGVGDGYSEVPIPVETVNLSERVIESIAGEESSLPVRALISFLDTYHDFTGFPWWTIIVSSTVALRIALLPLIVLQLKKIQRIAELLPRLPPPFPPPLSGKRFVDQISLFRREKRAAGCPSLLWFIASFAIQGGILWFQNLTEYPHGVLGSIFPVLMAGLHYTNVQLSFGASSLGKENGLLGLLAKQLALKHPASRTMLGLPDKVVPAAARKPEEIDTLETTLESPAKQLKISVENLTPKELIATQLQKGLLEEAVEYLECAISKLFLAGHPTEPEAIDLLIVASQWSGVACIRQFNFGTLQKAAHNFFELVQQGQLKLLSFVSQEKWEEGIAHLERIGNLKEPEEPKSKAHYYDGLVVLASALCNVGRNAEAEKYLRLAAAHNPQYNELLEQLENNDEDFVSDLSSSRRRDY